MANKIYEIAMKFAAKLDGNYLGAFNKAEKAMTSLEANQAKLTRAKKVFDSVYAQTKSVQSASQAYLKAKAEVERLAQAQKKAGGSNKELNAQLEKARLAVTKASQAYEKQKQKLAELRANTGNAGQSLAQLKRHQEELASATEKAAKSQERANKMMALANKGQQLKDAGTSRMLAGGIQLALLKQVADSFGDVISKGMAFESALRAVGTNANASAEQIRQLELQVEKLADNNALEQSDLIAGMDALAKKGFDTNKIMEIMPHVADLAGASNKSAAESAEYLAQMLDRYSLSADQASKVSDVLVTASLKSHTEMDELAHTMELVSPTARQLGLSFEEVAAMASALGEGGLRGKKGTSALQATLTALIKPGDQAKKTLEALKVNIYDDNNEMRSMSEIMGDLSKALGQYDEQTQNAFKANIFGQNNLAASSILMAKMTNGAFDEYVQSITKAGSASEKAALNDDTLASSMQKLQNSITNVKNELFKALEPAISATTKAMQGAVKKITEFIKNNQSLVATIVKIGGAIGGILGAMAAFNLGVGGLMWVVGSFITILTKLSAVIKIVRGVTLLFNAALWANPITWIVGLIVGLIAAGVLLYQNWDIVVEKCTAMWNTFETSFPGIASAVKLAFDKISKIWSGLKSIFSEQIDFVENVFSGNWSNAWQNVVNIFGTIWEGIKTVAKAPLNGLIWLVNKVIEGLNSLSFTLPDALKYVPGMSDLAGKNFGINIPLIPALANGGVATKPTLAMIGEGQESEAVLPLSKLSAMLSEPGTSVSNENQTVSINFAPTINVQGGTSTDMVAQLNSALHVSSEQIKREIERYFNNKQRVSYS